MEKRKKIYKAKNILNNNIDDYYFYNYQTNIKKIGYDGFLCFKLFNLKRPINHFPYILKYSDNPLSIEELDITSHNKDFFIRTAEVRADLDEYDFIINTNNAVIIFLADLKQKKLFYYLNYGSVTRFNQNPLGFDEVFYQYKPLSKENSDVFMEDLHRCLLSFYKQKSISSVNPII